MAAIELSDLSPDTTGDTITTGAQLAGKPELISPQEAFRLRDMEASAAAHAARLQSLGEEKHTAGGDSVKQIVFGGLDGIVTSFAIVAAAAGGDLRWEVILALGLSNLFADGLSMGVGEHLSAKAENEYAQLERYETVWIVPLVCTFFVFLCNYFIPFKIIVA
jgi:hypothetical protein